MIKLPKKVPCWKCGGRFVDMPECDCEDGYRYYFDDLAAAVREAGLFYELKDPYPNKDSDQCQVEIITQPMYRGWHGVIIEAPDPTAALLATINKVNEEAE